MFLVNSIIQNSNSINVFIFLNKHIFMHVKCNVLMYQSYNIINIKIQLKTI